MKAQGQSIYANVIAMSSHNPFELPEDKELFKISPELVGTFLGNYIQSCHYADAALGQFIAALKEKEMWEDAVLVVYGDHFGFHDSTPIEEQQLAAELMGIPSFTKVQMFNVPLVIRAPGLPSEVFHNTGGQIDMLPTLGNLLGLDLTKQIMFGQDLVNYQHNLIGQRTYLPTGSFINEEAMVIPGRGLEDAIVLPLDPHEEPKPGETYREDYNRALRLLEMSDSYVNALPLLETVTP
jgi:phosphoglycerol transferase MdoB-like AlkP superfamily enzyme